MKKEKIQLTLCIVLLITGFINPLYGQYYKLPYVENQSNLNLFVIGIEIGNDTTKVDLSVCNFTIDNYRFWLNPKGDSNAFVLEDDSGKTYAYLGEFGSSSKATPYSLKYNDCDTIQLFFEEVPPTVKIFNLIEGKKDNSWDFIGIDLKRQNRNIIERLNGRRFTFRESFKQSINWLFSETYRFRYYGVIENFNEEGQVLINITDVQLIDPSWASINYFEYREQNYNKARSNIGKRIWRNAANGSVLIWE